MRKFINLILEASSSPIDIVSDDGDVAHALYAVFDEDGEAYIRYWGTRDNRLVIQAIHSSGAVRGRDMLSWLKFAYKLPITVVEAIPEALPFWNVMEQEGLVDEVYVAEGRASPLEKVSVPLPHISY